MNHRVGPAVCAEALTWAASLAISVDSASLEVFLELAYEAVGSYQPWRLERRPAALDAIASLSTPASRRQALLDLWRRSRGPFVDPELDYVRDTVPGVHDIWDERCRDNEDEYGEDLARWLRSAADRADAASICEMEAAAQRRLIESADLDEVERIARSEHLFDMDESVVGTCLLRATRTTLRNEACPAELRNRVFHPYDRATLELAVRAGTGCFERARVHRMLGELREDALHTLLAAEPTKTLELLRELGRVSSDELVVGRLRHLDLRDRRTCRALFDSVLTPETLDIALEVMLVHPHADGLAWVLDDATNGTLTADQARRLVGAGCPPIAKAAMRHMPLTDLLPSDWDLAARCGTPWVAACPGHAAAEHPAMPERIFGGCLPLAPKATRIWYPGPLLELDDASFPQAPGWRSSLPKTVAEIHANARIMRNCTVSMIDHVLNGSLFLVIVHDPRGRRFNVEVTRDRSGFVIGQVKGWANRGIEPAWIRTAFTYQLNGPDDSSVWDTRCGFRRPLTPHRDRRRARASAARRKRR